MLPMWVGFWPGHRYPEKKYLRVVILAEDEQVDGTGEIIKIEQEELCEEEGDEEQEVTCKWMDLSLCSAGGLA